MITKLHIPNLQSATDNGHLEKALESIARVHSVEIDPASHEAIIEHEGANQNELTAAVKQLGYAADIR